MNTKLQFALVAVACLIYGQTVNAQVTYDFESATPLDGITSVSPSSLEALSGVGLGLTDNGVANTTTVIRPLTFGSPNVTGIADLTSFPSNTDYNVTWKEYRTSSALLKKGFLLRGSGTGGYTTGIKQGYYFMVQNNTSGTVTFRIFNVSASSSITQLVTSAAITIPGLANNIATWYRASVVGNVLNFEYSTDGTTFTIGATFTDSSSTYSSGTTQMVYGIGSSAIGHINDDIVYKNLAPLGVPSLGFDEKSIVAFKKGNTININSSEMTIKSVQLFDVNGRLIANKDNVNALETSFSNLSFAPGVILVKITGTDNKVVTKKLL